MLLQYSGETKKTNPIVLNTTMLQRTKTGSLRMNFLRLLIYENILGGAGRLLEFHGITLRYFLFFVSLVVCFFCLQRLVISKKLFYPIASVFAFFVLACAVGLLRGNSLSNIFVQSKGYLFLLMAFPFCCLITSKSIALKCIKSFVNAAFILSIIITVITVVLYLYPSSFAVLNPILLDLDLGHLAQVGSLYRVFFKSVPLIGIAWIIVFLRFVKKDKTQKRWVALLQLFMMTIAIFSSLTMGLWLALVVAVFSAFFLIGRNERHRALKYVAFAAIILLFFAGETVVWIASTRFSSADSSLVIKTDQILVMFRQWIQSPIFGKGFGNVVVFATEFGIREMLTIENSWMEILVTFGIVGFLVFVWFFATLMRQAARIAKSQTSKVNTAVFQGIVLGILLLCVVTAFNPFIINPIGLGFIGLSFGILNRVLLEKNTVGSLIYG